MEQTTAKEIIMSKYGADPLYLALLNSENQEQYDKAYDTLLQIRGNQAVKNFMVEVNKAFNQANKGE